MNLRVLGIGIVLTLAMVFMPAPVRATTPERVPGVVVFEGFRVDDGPSHDGTETTRGATTMVWRSAARPSSCT